MKKLFLTVILLVTGCDPIPPQCLFTQMETGVILSFERESERNCGRRGCSPYIFESLRIQREDGTVCTMTRYRNFGYHVGDKVRGPL